MTPPGEPEEAPPAKKEESVYELKDEDIVSTAPAAERPLAAKPAAPETPTKRPLLRETPELHIETPEDEDDFEIVLEPDDGAPMPTAGPMKPAPAADVLDAVPVAAAAAAGPAEPEPLPNVWEEREAERAAREQGSQEGLRARDLANYFNATEGVEAAKAGVLQVLNGFWLYLPYAAIMACLGSLHVIALAKWASTPRQALLWSIFFVALELVVFVGSLGCLKDAIFQRDMGIERLFYHGFRRLIPFFIAAVMTAPLAIAMFLGLSALFVALWTWDFTLFVKLPLYITWLLAATLCFEIVMFIPALTVLEERGPIMAAYNGLKFAAFRIWPIITMCVALLFIGGGVALLVWILHKAAVLWLYLMFPDWVNLLISNLVSSFVLCAILMEIMVSMMLLYLSHVEDPEELEHIRQTCKGPGASPILLKGGIVAFFAVAIGVAYYQNQVGVPLFGFFETTGRMRGEGVVERVSGEGRLMVIETGEGEPSWPAWSPDGKYLAYLRSRYVRPERSPEAGKAGQAGEGGAAALGRSAFAVGRQLYEICVVNVDKEDGDDREPMVVYEMEPKGGATIDYVEWGADRNIVATVRHRSEVSGRGTRIRVQHFSKLIRVDMAKGEATELEILAPITSRPRFSPDGKRIAFTGRKVTDDPWGAYVVNLETRKSSSVKCGLNPHTVAWGPDGGRLAIAAEIPVKAGAPPKTVVGYSDLASPDAVRLAEHKTVSTVDWGADGRIYYIADPPMSDWGTVEYGAEVVFAIDPKAEPETEPTRLTFHSGAEKQLAVSPEADRIAFITSRGGKPTLVVMEVKK